MKREYVQLPHPLNLEEHYVGGMYMSELLEGTRCIWDGGLSRGKPTLHIPWASVCNPKSGMVKLDIVPVATGLWSRHGNPILAPSEFLDRLPPFPLDGVLWAGRGELELCRRICSAKTPHKDWDKLHYCVLASPPLQALMASGEVKNTNTWVRFDISSFDRWVRSSANNIKINAMTKGSVLTQELFVLNGWVGWSGDIYVQRNIILPLEDEISTGVAKEFLDGVLEKGGIGISIRNPNAPWLPKRSEGWLTYTPTRIENDGLI